MKPLTSSFAYQRGVATILIVLLVGVAMTAASLGVVHSLKGAQQKQISAHASTHAQAAAWAGVEALRVYLTGLDFNQVMALAGKDIELSFAAGAVDDVELKAKINAVPLMMDDELDLPVIITAKSLSAKSSSIIDVVYHMELDSGNNTNNDSDCENNDAAAFYDKLDITGGEIVIRDKHGNPGNLTVVGDLTVSGSANFIGGLGDVKVTGSVSIANENVYTRFRSFERLTCSAGTYLKGAGLQFTLRASPCKAQSTPEKQAGKAFCPSTIKRTSPYRAHPISSLRYHLYRSTLRSSART